MNDAKIDFLDTKFESWISENSAIIVFHGIGKQNPLDTLDSFVRGLLDAYLEAGFDGSKFTLIHKFGQYKNPDGSNGYENFIRIKYEGSDHYLDCYEYLLGS